MQKTNRPGKNDKFNSVLFGNFMKFLTAIFLLVSAVIGFMYHNMLKMTVDEMVNINTSAAVQEVNMADTILRQCRSITANLAVDTDVKFYISNENVQIIMPNIIERLKNKIFSHKSVAEYIHSIYIYSEKTGMVYDGLTELNIREYPDNGWTEEYGENMGNTMYFIPRRFGGNYPNVISFVSNVGQNGAVVVNADIYMMAKAMGNIAKANTNFFILNGENQILYTGAEENFLQQYDPVILSKIKDSSNGLFKLNQKTFLGYIAQAEGQPDWKYVAVTSLREYNTAVGRIRLMLLLVFFIVMTAGVVAAYLIAAGTAKPVSKLVSIVNMDGGDQLLSELRNNEVKYVAAKILSIIDDNYELKNELNARLKEYENLQMTALQSQINPHFINNTLNVIYLKLVKKLGPEDEVTNMILAMTQLLQYAFAADCIQISVRQEVAFLKMYIDLMKTRYTNFQVEWEIDPQIYDEKIIRVCMQPIVENAVHHGVGGLLRPGQIWIRAWAAENMLIFEVEDNGAGISSEKIAELYASFAEPKIGSRHVGLKNVQKRLKIVYGPQAGLEIESCPDQFTRVRITLPKLPDR